MVPSLPIILRKVAQRYTEVPLPPRATGGKNSRVAEGSQVWELSTDWCEGVRDGAENVLAVKEQF